MIGGSVLLQGFGPGGSLSLVPTIGYMLPAPVAIRRTRSHGGDDVDYEDRRLARRKREEKIVLAVIRRFIGVIE